MSDELQPNHNGDNMNSEEKAEKMIEYVKSLKAIEQQIEPYKESLRDLKKEFVENEWLQKEEISAITRAYRMLKKNESIEDFVDAYHAIAGHKAIAGEDEDDA